MASEMKNIQWNMQSMQSNKHSLIAFIHKYLLEIILLRVNYANNQGGRFATLFKYRIIELEDNHINNEFQ